MPTYEYVCGECGHEFERFQKMSDPVLRKCPECGRQKLRRLLGAGAGIIFKGSGFYETDYRRKSAPGRAGTESASPGKDAGSGQKTDETRAAD